MVDVSAPFAGFQCSVPLLALLNDLLSFVGQEVVELWEPCRNVFTHDSAQAHL